MTVKVNKSKDYTISEIRSGFFNTVVSCIVVSIVLNVILCLFH